MKKSLLSLFLLLSTTSFVSAMEEYATDLQPSSAKRSLPKANEVDAALENHPISSLRQIKIGDQTWDIKNLFWNVQMVSDSTFVENIKNRSYQSFVNPETSRVYVNEVSASPIIHLVSFELYNYKPSFEGDEPTATTHVTNPYFVTIEALSKLISETDTLRSNPPKHLTEAIETTLKAQPFSSLRQIQASDEVWGVTYIA